MLSGLDLVCSRLRRKGSSGLPRGEVPLTGVYFFWRIIAWPKPESPYFGQLALASVSDPGAEIRSLTLSGSISHVVLHQNSLL